MLAKVYFGRNMLRDINGKFVFPRDFQARLYPNYELPLVGLRKSSLALPVRKGFALLIKPDRTVWQVSEKRLIRDYGEYAETNSTLMVRRKPEKAIVGIYPHPNCYTIIRARGAKKKNVEELLDSPISPTEEQKTLLREIREILERGLENKKFTVLISLPHFESNDYILKQARGVVKRLNDFNSEPKGKRRFFRVSFLHQSHIITEEKEYRIPAYTFIIVYKGIIGTLSDCRDVVYSNLKVMSTGRRKEGFEIYTFQEKGPEMLFGHRYRKIEPFELKDSLELYKKLGELRGDRFNHDYERDLELAIRTKRNGNYFIGGAYRNP